MHAGRSLLISEVKTHYANFSSTLNYLPINLNMFMYYRMVLELRTEQFWLKLAFTPPSDCKPGPGFEKTGFGF